MEGEIATERTSLRTFPRIGQLRSAQREVSLKFCSNDRVPELARGCARNAQWITPTG